MFIDFRERGTERGVCVRERERNGADGLFPIPAPTGNGTHNLGMCSEWKSNPQPFGQGMKLQPTEPPGQGSLSSFRYR